MKVLLIENGVLTSRYLKRVIQRNAVECDLISCMNKSEALEIARKKHPNLIIMDINKPCTDGLELVKELKNVEPGIYILLISVLDQLVWLKKTISLGVDDYLVKPFAAPELLARIRALSRRKGEMIVDDSLSFADFHLNLSSYELEGKHGNVRLTLKEFEILRYFMYRPHRAVTKDELIEKVWGFDSEADYNNIEVYISFLRKKLAHIGSQAVITTLRGIGYKLEE